MAANLGELLDELLNEEVNFVLAGGMAAVAQGAPVTTFDLDIVHERTPENVDRLMNVLIKLHAHVREPTNRHLPPDKQALLGTGHSLLVTDLGPLDCLGAEGGLDFVALEPQAIRLPFHQRTLRVVTLELLLKLKEQWPDDESKWRASILRKTIGAKQNTNE